MRTWFITGASRGIGALIAAEALAAGDRVVATARHPETVTQALGTSDRLLAVKLDVTDEAQAHAAAGEMSCSSATGNSSCNSVREENVMPRKCQLFFVRAVYADRASASIIRALSEIGRRRKRQSG
jgi:NAD(P)-dependent dehydrogenase (short-subunit alcohol dehydrogenase family)